MVREVGMNTDAYKEEKTHGTVNCTTRNVKQSGLYNAG